MTKKKTAARPSTPPPPASSALKDAAKPDAAKAKNAAKAKGAVKARAADAPAPHAPVIVWLRNDLRVEDNPALQAARETSAPLIPVYILDDDAPRAPRGASRWWLHHSLAALGGQFAALGAPLVLRRGDSAACLRRLIADTGAGAVYWNRRYYAEHIAIDAALKRDLVEAGLRVESFNGSLLREPWEVKTGSGGFYKVYSPFWRALRAMGPARPEAPPSPRKLTGPASAPASAPASDALDEWALRPAKPDWAAAFSETWTPGAKGAHKRLRDFLNGPADQYSDGRNRPDLEFTSRLSPHLAFGEIGPTQIWRETMTAIDKGAVDAGSADTFLAEIGWREFSNNLLFHFEARPDEPMRAEFADYPWRDDKRGLRAWREGRTGFPIVDAGMRQLWRTGWMHNRVRMIVASFLIKDLLIPWQEGEAWFQNTLLDADIANNSASWQWVAGCGADAAPYFRIFNPVSQGEKFDPEGSYVRQYVPEIAALPKKYIHAPWTAPEAALREAGVALGESYPAPIVDHAEARRRALAGYDKIKKTA